MDQKQEGAETAHARVSLFNAVLKIPMQFVILLSGVLLFVLHLFTMPPLFFNTSALERVRASPERRELAALEGRYATAFTVERTQRIGMLQLSGQNDLHLRLGAHYEQRPGKSPPCAKRPAY